MRSLSLSKPHLIVMVGIPGSGKSYFADKFADTFVAPYVSYEKISKDIFGKTLYNSEQKSIVSKVASREMNELLKTKQTVIYEGATSLRANRSLIAQRAVQSGYTPLFIWVQTDPLTAKTRAMKSGSTSTEDFDRQMRLFSAPLAHEKSIVISGKHTYATQVKNVLKRLAEPHVEALAIKTPDPRPQQTKRSIIIR